MIPRMSKSSHLLCSSVRRRRSITWHRSWLPSEWTSRVDWANESRGVISESEIVEYMNKLESRRDKLHEIRRFISPEQKVLMKKEFEVFLTVRDEKHEWLISSGLQKWCSTDWCASPDLGEVRSSSLRQPVLHRYDWLLYEASLFCGRFCSPADFIIQHLVQLHEIHQREILQYECHQKDHGGWDQTVERWGLIRRKDWKKSSGIDREDSHGCKRHSSGF